MTTLTAKDLTKEFPRSPLQTLGGYPWLGRLVDKVRSAHAGLLGEYIAYPCGGDQRFLKTVGVDPTALADRIKGGASDAEVVAWIQAHQSNEAQDNLAAYRQHFEAPVQPEHAEYLAGALAELAKARPELDLSWVNNFTKLICAEENHAWPSA